MNGPLVYSNAPAPTPPPTPTILTVLPYGASVTINELQQLMHGFFGFGVLSEEQQIDYSALCDDLQSRVDVAAARSEAR